jgi:hypothetical protein
MHSERILPLSGAAGSFNLMKYHNIDRGIFGRGCHIMPRQARLDVIILVSEK